MAEMMKYLASLILLLCAEFSCAQPSETHFQFGLPVFQNVTGFGLDTKGGRGGVIIRVTNLEKEGPGSLAEALQAAGPRIVVFEVAGVIDLERSTLQISDPYITIAGQTAPAPGITIIKGGIRIATHDVIVQHIKVRPGEAGHKKKCGWEVDGIATTGGACNVVVDHCSLTWATDENLSASGPRFDGKNTEEWRKNTSHRVVFSHCIIAEGLSRSTHAKGEHSKGSLIHDNATEILIIGNLFANNMRRNPYCKGGTQVAILNNYIYNPGRSAIHYKLVKREWKGRDPVMGTIVAVGNVITFGLDSKRLISGGSFKSPVQVYWQDNEVATIADAEALTGKFTRLDSVPFWPEGLTAMPACEVRESVLRNAGAFPLHRDEIDRRIIREVQAGRGKIIDSELEVGGYPHTEPVYRKFDANEWDLSSLTKKTEQ